MDEIKELKSQAYDLMLIMDQTRLRLQQISARIAELSKEQKKDE